jgi:hypothetical protein
MQKKPKRDGKASRPELADRVAEVLRIRLDGAAFHDLIDYAHEKGWNVSERQLWRYVHKADELFAERRERSRRRLVALHQARREALYARAVNAADYRTALAILADLARLQKLYFDPADLREVERRVREIEKRFGIDPAARPAANEVPHAPPR